MKESKWCEVCGFSSRTFESNQSIFVRIDGSKSFGYGWVVLIRFRMIGTKFFQCNESILILNREAGWSNNRAVPIESVSHFIQTIEFRSKIMSRILAVWHGADVKKKKLIRSRNSNRRDTFLGVRTCFRTVCIPPRLFFKPIEQKGFIISDSRQDRLYIDFLSRKRERKRARDGERKEFSNSFRLTRRRKERWWRCRPTGTTVL